MKLSDWVVREGLLDQGTVKVLISGGVLGAALVLGGCNSARILDPLQSGSVEADPAQQEARQNSPSVEQTTLSSRSAAQKTQDWKLVPDESFLSFISVKQTDIAEVSTFERYDVRVDSDGAASVSIDLSSVATGVELRDQRVRDHLFETETYPEATVDLTLDMKSVSEIETGTKVGMATTAVVTLHGMSVTVTGDLEVMRLADDKVVVASTKPIVLHASDFDMTGGIAYLIELAGLQSISSAVPVDFMFTLQAD